MIKIAICDDEKKELDIVIALLNQYIQKRTDINISYSGFSSGKDLLCSEECTNFDIYVLDVLMPPQNGIETGIKLREMGAKGEIIYLTTSRDYAVESYRVRTFYYLIKPVKREEFFDTLDQAIEYITKNIRESILIHTTKGLCLVALDHIIYAERVGRTIAYDCINEKKIISVSLHKSFKESVLPILKDKCFILCGSSYILNLRHILSIENNTAKMDNGDMVPLPRRLTVNIKQTWMNYWLGGK